ARSACDVRCAGERSRRCAMRIFVTGASGVIGRRVVPLFVAAGHDVTAIGRNPEKRTSLERDGAKTVDVSLFDPIRLRDAMKEHDTIVNLATHMPSSFVRACLPGAWSENDRIRREGSANVADAALSVGATLLVQESFAPVYPACGNSWIDESV